MVSRGIRNCNPGNIRITKDKWKGLRDEQTDGSFFQFVSMEWGYRALMRTLQNYQRRHGCETVADFIKRWAPPTENYTAGYIGTVCRRMGVPTTYAPDVNDKVTMCEMAAAISYVENGVEPVMEEIERGWELLKG